MTADVLERLRDAQNRHDLDAFLDCFDSGMAGRTAPPDPPAEFWGRGSGVIAKVE